MPRTFPEGFRWGVATSGHQTEGGNSRSDTWFLEHVRPTVFREPSGQACDGYQLWREDVDLAAGLGLDTYRFPVETHRAAFLEPALDALLDAIEDGVPVVGYLHWTLL